MLLSPRFEDALKYAAIVHAGQMRKGTDIPYFAHLLAVTSLVLEYGGDEDAAIGALLHDAGEDAGGDNRIADIGCRFGHSVAEIVIGCTDTTVQPKPPWRERKEKYIAHLATATAATLLVSCCDKLHNARSIVADLRVHGATVWDRFKGGKDGTLWYYKTLAATFDQLNVPKPLVHELDRTVKRMQKLANRGSADS
jgi:(p)ppGpp synthase/HD superfamily hydrolase